MKNNNQLDVFHSQEKAIHQALWLNFKYRITNSKFGIISYPQEKWKVVDVVLSEVMKNLFVDNLPKDYSQMSYDDIRHIKMDKAPLPHWEKLTGLFSTMDGELLRFILYTKIPLEKLIRDELASRGHDENHRWCGFEKAGEIWLK